MDDRERSEGAKAIETALGPPLIRSGRLWELDLRQLPLFHGLSVLSRALGEMALAAVREGREEISFARDLRHAENPELLDILGIDRVRVRAEREVGPAIAADPELFQDRLRALFGSLQVERHRRALLPPPESNATSRALVFHFSTPLPLRFVLERLPTARAARGALRLSLELLGGRCSDLSTFPHQLVEEEGRRFYIAGSTRISQTLADAVRRESERGRRSTTERRQAGNHLFQQLDKAGFAGLERIVISWGEAGVRHALESDPGVLDGDLKRLLLALEDAAVRERIACGETLLVRTGELPLYVDRTQLGRALNLGLGEHRERKDLAGFLRSMPTTSELVASSAPDALASTKVFLIHHNTAEVLGWIGALRDLGCRDLTVVFVTYAARTPDAYLDALLDVPADELRCHALVNIPEEGSVEGHYQLSTRFSRFEGRDEVNRHLREGRLRFLEAMRCVAAVEFVRQLERAEVAGEEVLLVEDGGYLAPLLHTLVARSARIGDLAVPEGLLATPVRPLGELLAERWIGSVEHTRNGLDRLREVEEQEGLHRPALTIATSRHKIEVEAAEVATTVLTATESVLHALGRVLSRRRPLLIGCRGAIGSHLARELAHRLRGVERRFWGLDLKVRPPEEGPTVAAEGAGPAALVERRSLASIPMPERLAFDLVLGAAGVSVFGPEELESWLVDGTRRELVLVSASTKRVEFAAISAWIDERLREERSQLGSRVLSIAIEDLRDPLSDRLHGRRVRFEFPEEPERGTKELILAADTTPINFLFYGVPTEVIDEVLAELLRCALLLRAQPDSFPKRVLELDRDFAADGTLL